MLKLSANTIYEVIIALLIFSIVASISFFTIYKIAENLDRKNTLKYENIIAEYKINKLGDVVLETSIYPYSDKFLLNKYIIFNNKGDTLYVKHELQYILNEN